MSTAAGTGAMHCAHCGRPAATLVWIGGMGYHPECTRGPGYEEPTYKPVPNWPTMVTWPAMTEDRVRQIVREELLVLRATKGLVVPACWCESCDVKANDGLRSRMSLCPECGDKRCPRAQDHDNPCQHRT